ncbi:MAG TPA: DUF1549 domain-containing protein, partial [Pirellulaceae bacterium]|nr:DUF1549 domain-containing protein [Pirellulaceae bacterium]
MRKLLTALLCCCVALVLVRTAPADDLLPEDRSIEEAIDHYVDAKLKTAGVQPAPQAPDYELIRRTTLDLVGRPATVAEAKQYLGESDAAKRVQLVDRLLASASFPRHQADQFDALLMSGTNANLRE